MSSESALVSIDSGDIDVVSQALAALSLIEAKINDSEDLGELHDIADQAALLIEMQRIRDLSAELAIAALRVSVLAWRRIGQLGASVGTTTERTTARTLARLSLAEVDSFLAEFTGRSANGLAKIVAARLRERDAVEDLRTNGTNNTPAHDPSDSSYTRARSDVVNLHHSAQHILREIERRSEDLTTTQAALELLAALDVPADSLTVSAARQVVMEAMMAPEPPDDAIRRDHLKYLPRFVTYSTSEGEWLRIPVGVATVHQVRWMANYRRTQANDLMRRAEELDLAATELERSSLHPETDLVRGHWGRCCDLHNAEQVAS